MTISSGLVSSFEEPLLEGWGTMGLWRTSGLQDLSSFLYYWQGSYLGGRPVLAFDPIDWGWLMWPLKLVVLAPLCGAFLFQLSLHPLACFFPFFFFFEEIYKISNPVIFLLPVAACHLANMFKIHIPPFPFSPPLWSGIWSLGFGVKLAAWPLSAVFITAALPVAASHSSH